MTTVTQDASSDSPKPASDATAATASAAKPESTEANPLDPFSDDGANKSVQSTVTAPSTAQHEEQPANEPHANQENPSSDVPQQIPPEIEGLKAMFPDFDVAILLSVLQSVDGNQERAADILLGMSDPEYVSQSHNAQQPQQRELTQEELDEQLARRLVFEEQQQEAQLQQQASWHPDELYPGHQYRGQSFGQRRDVPYQPRQGGPHPQGQGQWSGQQGGGKDTMTEVQEQLSKFAETGKKTFSSLVSKVKAKMQEYEQNRNSGSSSNPPQSSWGSGTPSSQGSQYYSPPPGPPGGGDYNRSAGYDAAPQQPTWKGTTAAEPTPPATSATPTPAPEVVKSTSPPPVIAPRPTSAGSTPPVNVDPTKIGMLPKRPVSLLGSTSAQSATTRKASDGDELDYVENPFEDERR